MLSLVFTLQKGESAMALTRWFSAIIAVFMLAACGGGIAEEPTATIRPTSTSTPVSTPLPDVATSVPAGMDAGNPVRFVLVAEQNQAVAQALAGQLSEIGELAVEVEFVRSQAEALSGLCNATPGNATMVWLRDFAAGVAALQDCGVPRVQITREVGRDSLTGEAGVLLASFEADFENADAAAAQLPGRTFCRIALEDLYSWTLPTLLLSANDLSIMDFEDINEVDDQDALLAGLQDGSCDAIGLRQIAWEAAQDADETLEENINLLATSPVFPYGVLYFSYDVSLEVINTLTEAMFELEAAGLNLEATPEAEATAEATPAAEVTESADAITLRDLFGEGQFIAAEAADFAELAAFLRETGLDFTSVAD